MAEIITCPFGCRTEIKKIKRRFNDCSTLLYHLKNEHGVPMDAIKICVDSSKLPPHLIKALTPKKSSPGAYAASSPAPTKEVKRIKAREITEDNSDEDDFDEDDFDDLINSVKNKCTLTLKYEKTEEDEVANEEDEDDDDEL